MTAATAHRVDWFRVLDALSREGYSLRDIEHFTKIPKSSLLHYKGGGEPMYSNGQRLVKFWADCVGQAADQVPMISPFDYRA